MEQAINARADWMRGALRRFFAFSLFHKLHGRSLLVRDITGFECAQAVCHAPLSAEGILS